MWPEKQLRMTTDSVNVSLNNPLGAAVFSAYSPDRIS